MRVYLLLAAVLAVIMGGCASSGLRNAFNSEGFPKQQYYIGGGLQVEYTARQEGTLIFADRVSKKIIQTKSMTPDDSYEISMRPNDASVLENVGINPMDMKLSLYFIPVDKAENDDAKMKPDKHDIDDLKPEN